MAERQIYSQGFVYYVDSSPNTDFEVPAGFTAVVREFDCTVGLASSVFSLNVQQSATAPAIGIVIFHLLGELQSGQWTGRVVVNEGGFISLFQQTLGVDATAYIGGYLLRN